jgi:hypothetical protein
VLAATVLAPRCRPVRAAALLLGAAGVVVVRLLELPLEIGATPGARTGSALLLVVACLVLLLVAAGLAGAQARSQANRPVPVRR